MTSLSTHVLDAVSGAPAVGVGVELLLHTDDGWRTLDQQPTDSDGRIARVGPAELDPAAYRLVFATGAYFRSGGLPAFFPEVVVSFVVDEERHYHVPLLLSPYAYSTYRGS